LIDEGGLGVEDDFVDLSKRLEATLYIKRFDIKEFKNYDNGYIKEEKFDFSDKRYNLHSTLYDFIFLYQRDIKIETLKNCYRTLKNAGNLFLFCDKDRGECLELLQESNYVAINDIDEFKDFYIISAKKMHGWMKV